MLPAVNFFMADVGGGIGPYLSIWLQRNAGFGAEQVGTVLTVGSLVGAALATPAGRAVDRFGRPRLMLALACLLIVAGTLALIPARAFWAVLLAQSVVSAGGALTGPSLTGLTLAVAGKRHFPRQQGANEAANHAGNVASNLAIAGISRAVGISAAFAVLAATAAAAVATLVMMPVPVRDEPPRCVGEIAERSAGGTGLLHDRRLPVLIAAMSLFHLGNSAMLPMFALRIEGLGGDPTAWISTAVIVLYLAMIPVAVLGGRCAERFGRRPVLLAALAVLPVRAGLAALATDVSWLIPMEILDALGAGLISVAAAPAIADVTYGTGRTQTAVGAMQAGQSAAAALSTLIAGMVAAHVSWPAAFATLGVFPVLGLLLLARLRLPGGERPVSRPAHPRAAATSLAV
jgi:MFS family permease